MTEGGKQYITLGSYEMQSWDCDQEEIVSSGKKQPLSWEILSYSSDKKRALVLCRNIIVFKSYNINYRDINWENCTLRRWLNRDFYEAAFTAEERKLIIPTTISNPANAKFGTGGCNDTEDRIFLLSIDEAKGYFPNDDARVRTTYNGLAHWWFLRSACGSNEVALVTLYGEVDDFISLYEDHGYIYNSVNGVCPAFWINLNLHI